MFEVTHPFHPLKGQQFALVTRKLNWGEDRVMYFNPAGELRSMPTSWTSEASATHCVTASGARSWFRADDLQALAALLQTVQSQMAGGRGGVK